MDQSDTIFIFCTYIYFIIFPREDIILWGSNILEIRYMLFNSILDKELYFSKVLGTKLFKVIVLHLVKISLFITKNDKSLKLKFKLNQNSGKCILHLYILLS